MDAFDVALLEARAQVIESLKNDPVKAYMRWKRTQTQAFLSPPRDWCLKIRANDRRITHRTAVIEPYSAAEYHEEHFVRFAGSELRHLVKPVEIRRPAWNESANCRRRNNGIEGRRKMNRSWKSDLRRVENDRRVDLHKSQIVNPLAPDRSGDTL